MMMPGLALRSAAMCFLAWSAYCWPGPGSSETIRLMAAWASMKIVTLSGMVCFSPPIPVSLQGRSTLRRRPPCCSPYEF